MHSLFVNCFQQKFVSRVHIWMNDWMEAKEAWTQKNWILYTGIVSQRHFSTGFALQLEN